MNKIQNSCSRSSCSRRRGVCLLAVCLALGVTQLTTCNDGGSVDDSGPAAQAPGGGGPADGSAPAAMPSDLRRAFIAARMAEAREEHAFSACGDEAGALAASSPEQSLAFELGPSGLAITPASGGPGALRVEVRFAGIGRPGRLSPPAEAVPEAEGNLVTYRRGPVEEWYRSGPPGLEQGFEVRERPEGDGPLVLEVTVGGGMSPQLDERSGFVVLREGMEGRLIYSDLFAEDADGRPLGARMAVEGQSVLLLVDDAEAHYPVSIDPLVWLQQQKLTAADSAGGDQLGYSVAIYVDTAVVGAYEDDVGASDQGSAYVFVRSAGVWSQQAKLTAADCADGDRFGSSVAIYGDTVVVGAPQDDVGANTDQGSAYVFVRSGVAWSPQQKLTASDGAASDQFGNSVAIYGDTVVVGAPMDDAGANSNQGSAYVFVRSGVTWSQQAKLTAADGLTNDSFGISVAISGDTAMAGAYLDDVAANADQGSAYVFVRSGIAWSQQAKLTAADGAAGDFLGYSVAIYGDTAVVGVPMDSMGGTGTIEGSAYVFVRSGVVWSQNQKLTAADAAISDLFGHSVAIYADTIVVGAVSDDMTYGDEGSAYVFLGRYELGDPCTSAIQCHSGYCVDDVCCDNDCGGGVTTDCQACSTTRGTAADGTCGPLTAAFAPTITCRSSAGACDIAETCSSTSMSCPADAFAAAGTVCRGLAGVCDVAESCSGTDALCPSDAFAAAGETCRASSGSCDAAESCTGDSTSCPADDYEPAGTECSDPTCADGEATAAGTCDGAGGCDVPAPIPCEPYACGETGCLTSCDDSADCAPGYECVGTACLPAAADGEEEVEGEADAVTEPVADTAADTTTDAAGEAATDGAGDGDAATDGDAETETPSAAGGCGCVLVG